MVRSRAASQRKGVRQGSVEGPTIFVVLYNMILEAAGDPEGRQRDWRA